MGHKDVKTAMQYQDPELEIMRAALDQPGTPTDGQGLTEKFYGHTLKPSTS
jgi:hypothetical protein